jgi:glutathione S-transferase
VFRYFDVFDRIADFRVVEDMPKVCRWRAALAQRPSVVGAVSEEYGELLMTFLKARGSRLSLMIMESARLH